MSNDPLSDILRLTEATSVMSGGFVAGGSWALRFPPPTELIFAVLAKGSCWFQLDGAKQALRCELGDVALVSGSRGYVLASSLDVPAEDALQALGNKDGSLGKIGEGAECVMLGGSVSLLPSNATLLTNALPALVTVGGASPGAASLRWIIDRILEEQASTLPGSSVASSQLAQLLFTQVLRVHLASAEVRAAGWMRAIGDAQVAPALRCMHADPARSWTLHELAKESGMSRTSFAVRFKSVAGVAPLGYLAEWRMRLAQKALRDEATPVSEVAARLGYSSESAFSQAFKRVTGTRPREYRTAYGSSSRRSLTVVVGRATSPG